MTPLASSNLDAFEYDAATQRLTIRFKSGKSYSYGSVPETVAEGLKDASSPGQYFNSAIKNIYAEV